MSRYAVLTWAVLASAGIAVVGCQAPSERANPERKPTMRVHYIEIVCSDVSAHCATLEQVHGLSFGPEVADLGNARVAEAGDGTLIGVRAPLAEHEQPITRTYLAVDDVAKAIAAAEAGGATIAYPPTQQGETGIWAIYIRDDIQYGLWQR